MPRLQPGRPFIACLDRSAPGAAPLSASMAETQAQNDQICGAQLEVINEPIAAPNGGSGADESGRPVTFCDR